MLLAAVSLALVSVSSASAGIRFGPCKGNETLACGRLTVPLDWSGQVPGTISLALRRRRAPLGDGRSAVIALAGGPGQAAIPFTASFAEILGPILRTRDLIVFDQRGTGASGPLSCPAFEASSGRSLGSLVRTCAAQLGLSRRFYTTPASVQDIEAIRIAGGYEKLVLYGTSYGSKVAEEYAEQHPEHVEALLLDSVVTPNGPEPLSAATFAAIPRVLRQLCAFGDCRGVTRHPVGNLRALVQLAEAHPLRGVAIDGHGQRRTLQITSTAILDLLVDGDLDPILRAEIPGAVRAALSGDLSPLARMLADVQRSDEAGVGAIDVPLYYATICEEEQFRWNRSATPARRLAEAAAQARALAAKEVSPFTWRDVLRFSDMPACASWPLQGPPPAPRTESFPRVPTLILSGGEDLRTPTAEARALAAKIPGAHLLVVPNAGHDVLATEQSSCGLEAVRALFSRAAIKRCEAVRPVPLLRPTPPPPRSLLTISPTRPYKGTPGRTLHALALSLADLDKQLTIALLESESAQPPAVRLGGLRAGFAVLSAGQLHLHDYSFIPGVRLTGAIRSETATLRISGGQAARGTLQIYPDGRMTGRLGGVDVNVPARRITASLELLGAASGHESLETIDYAAKRTRARARSTASIDGQRH